MPDFSSDFDDDDPADGEPFDTEPPRRRGGGGLSAGDRDQLQILWILHLVSAILSLIALAFLGLWTAAVLSMAGGRGGGPPAGMATLMAAIGGGAALLTGATAAGQFLAAWNLYRRRGRTVCLVVAAVECLNVPLGTALGVFTFVVLSRPGVRAAFERDEYRR